MAPASVEAQVTTYSELEKCTYSILNFRNHLLKTSHGVFFRLAHGEEWILASRGGPGHRLAFQTKGPHQVHGLVHSVKDGFVVNVVGFTD